MDVACWQAGLEPGPTLALMVAEPGEAWAATGSVAEGLRLRPVLDGGAAREFADVHLERFGEGFEAVVGHFARPEVLLSDDVDAWVADVDGGTAGCAMTVRTRDLAGLFWVATREAARRHGIGGALTRLLCARAFAGGVRAVHLQATEMGRPVYAAAGFADLGLARQWRVSPAPCSAGASGKAPSGAR